MIMSELCVGEQHEKLGSFNAAIKFYAEGKQVAEDNFGTRHPLYTKCINAMGGARLKSKYQTPGSEINPSEFFLSNQFEDLQKLIENYCLVKDHFNMKLIEYFNALSHSS